MTAADTLATSEVIQKSDYANLDNPEAGIFVASKILADIDAYTAKIYDDGFRWHLGASLIGDECKRKLWYIFRWIGGVTHSGRQQRLFNRGHLEELRHAEWLRGIGFTVWTHDESQTKPDGTHPQLRIKNKCKGHLGGSLDGIVQFPERYGIPGYAILESKTSGTGAGFNKTKNETIAAAKPLHYAQNSIYGASYDIKHVLYICANKNDDDLAIKVERLDFQLAEKLEAKAESIIFSQEPPAKIALNPNVAPCRYCDYKDTCHAQKPPQINCRSCVKCNAVDNAEFYCSQWDGIIPRDAVPKACPEWKSITIESIVGKPAKAQKNQAAIPENEIPF